MQKYSEILKILSSSRDVANDDLIFISKDIELYKGVLDRFSVIYEQQAEGIKIDFSVQSFKIFKTKKDFIKRSSISDFSKDLLIIENELYFSDGQSNQVNFFVNMLYWHKFITLFRDKSIFHYDDSLNKKFIFLSEMHGKVEVGYGVRYFSDYFDLTNIEELYESIFKKLDLSEEFKSFFRNSFMSVAKNCELADTRFSKSLASIGKIFESAVRDFELFKNKFSFEDFKNNLDKDKDKYFKEYQANLSDFLSKIASLPIQFGVYIYLILRFEENLFPLVLIAVLIFSWGWFSYSSIGHVIFNIDYIRGKFLIHLKKIELGSGMDKTETDQYQKEISGQFFRVIKLIKAYRYTTMIFSLISIGFCLYFIANLSEGFLNFIFSMWLESKTLFFCLLERF